MELHSARVNLYTTKERSDLDTESFILTKFLILNEETANLMLRLLQYLLNNVQTVRWVNFERGRYCSLK